MALEVVVEELCQEGGAGTGLQLVLELLQVLPPGARREVPLEGLGGRRRINPHHNFIEEENTH